jgi:hypothetical protein
MSDAEKLRDLAEILQLLLAHISGARPMSVTEHQVCLEAVEKILAEPVR